VTRTQVTPQRNLAAHLVSWLVAGAIIGWVVMYALLRLGGDSPNDAAAPALIGALLGIAAAGGVVFWARRAEAAGHPMGRKRIRKADPARMSARDREVVRFVWPVLLGAAAIATVIAVVLLFHWVGIHGARPKSVLLMVLWDLVIAAWLFDEGQRVREFVFEGLDSLYFGCLLTMVLASIGVSRSVVSGGEVILIVATGLAAAAIGVLSWRIAGGRVAPIAGVVAIAVAAICLIAPLTG
jgi:hypothetical protein